MIVTWPFLSTSTTTTTKKVSHFSLWVLDQSLGHNVQWKRRGHTATHPVRRCPQRGGCFLSPLHMCENSLGMDNKSKSNKSTPERTEHNNNPAFTKAIAATSRRLYVLRRQISGFLQHHQRYRMILGLNQTWLYIRTSALFRESSGRMLHVLRRHQNDTLHHHQGCIQNLQNRPQQVLFKMSIRMNKGVSTPLTSREFAFVPNWPSVAIHPLIRCGWAFQSQCQNFCFFF